VIYRESMATSVKLLCYIISYLRSIGYLSVPKVPPCTLGKSLRRLAKYCTKLYFAGCAPFGRSTQIQGIVYVTESLISVYMFICLFVYLFSVSCICFDPGLRQKTAVWWAILGWAFIVPRPSMGSEEKK